MAAVVSTRFIEPVVRNLSAEPGVKPAKIIQWKSGRWEDFSGGVIIETPVSLTVNGEIWLTFLCTPVDLDALAVGFLFNENFIQSQSDLASVRVCPTGENVDVWTNHAVQRPKTWRRTSGCTGGMTAEQNTHSRGSVDLREIRLRSDQIAGMVGQLFDCQELYRQVGGVHTSALSDGQRVVVSAEDIGRHNTLDKIAGKCLIHSINPGKGVLLTTGRVSSEMLQKAARIQASMIVSRTSPSSLSVALAEELGITLIGYAHSDRFNIYAHPERISDYTG